MTPEETQQGIDQAVALFGQMADTMDELSKLARELNAMLAARPTVSDLLAPLQPAPATPAERRIAATIHDIILPAFINRIKDAVCVAYDVPLAAMTSRDRQAKFVRARHVAMWLVRKHAGRNIAQVAKEFGLDHGTVSYACRMMDNLQQCDPKEAQRIGLLDLDIARLKAER